MARKGKKFYLPRSIRRMYPNVKHAYDATKPVEVSVSTLDCKMAKLLDPSECALAQAAKRELQADGVIIGMNSSYIINGDTATRFATPGSVQREIVSFDRHGDFAPGEYYLTPKSPSNKLGTKHTKKYNGSREGAKYAKRKFHHSARVRVLPKGQEGE